MMSLVSGCCTCDFFDHSVMNFGHLALWICVKYLPVMTQRISLYFYTVIADVTLRCVYEKYLFCSFTKK